MFKNIKSTKRGFMMIEVLIAASIITVSVLTILGVADRSLYVSRRTVHSVQATFLMEEGTEAVKILRDNGWANISGLNVATTYYPVFSSGSWSLSSTSSLVGIFTRTINIANVNRDASTKDIAASGTYDSGTKLITVTVSWPEGGNTITKTISFYIIDIFS